MPTKASYQIVGSACACVDSVHLSVFFANLYNVLSGVPFRQTIVIDLTEERNQHHLHSAASADITKRATHHQRKAAPQLAFASASPSSAESSSTAKSAAAGKTEEAVPPTPPLTGAADDRKTA